MDLTCWLNNISGSTPISLITFPGTHDSATQYVKLSLFSRCQEQSIAQQLASGIRLLDIRLEYTKTGFYAVHGIADCRKSRKAHSPRLRFADIFEDILLFLNMQPSETVVASIKMDRGSNADEFFPAFYDQFIEPYRANWYLENRIPALDECRGKLVLMRRCMTGNESRIFTDNNTGLNFAACYGRESFEDGLPTPCPAETVNGDNTAFTAVIQDSFMLNSKQKWDKAVKPALDAFTPSSNIISINYLSTAGMPFIPRFNSRYVNAKFRMYKLQHNKCYGWIFIDFPTADILKNIIECNI